MAFAMSSSITLFQYQSFAKKPFSSLRRDLAHLLNSVRCARISGCSMMNPLIVRCSRGTETGFVSRGDGEAETGLKEERVILPVSIESFSVLRSERKKGERKVYLVAAMASSLGFTFMAAAAVYYRFAWQMEGRAVPLTEMLGTFSLAVGSAVGMEYWARWAHRALWHASLWHMHESHHRPRDGPFELNDVFALINAFPAVALLAFGFFHRGFFSGLCFGAGLGITLYGMAYMFVHDGLVHRRFPVGPIASVPYFQWVAAAHQIHHADKFNGVPYGLFLGHKELEEVGGMEELEREIKRRVKVFGGSSNQS